MPPLKRLCISFIKTRALFLIAGYMIYNMILEEKRSLLYNLLYAAWMAFLFALFLMRL